MNKKKYRINEISKLFHIPVSTLHYWENAGLLKSNRADNNYRTYEKHDIFDIWEIDLYRKMNVPVKELRSLYDMRVNDIEEILDKTEGTLEKEIQEKQKMMQKLINYKQNITQWKNIVAHNYEIGIPHFTKLEIDLFNEESMKKTIGNPNQCCIYFSKANHYQGLMCFPHEGHIELEELHQNREKKIEKQGTVWQINIDQYAYIECWIRTEINHIENNNISEVLAHMKQMGYEVNDMITSFLFSAYDDVRYDYHRAWVEVKRL